MENSKLNEEKFPSQFKEQQQRKNLFLRQFIWEYEKYLQYPFSSFTFGKSILSCRKHLRVISTFKKVIWMLDIIFPPSCEEIEKKKLCTRRGLKPERENKRFQVPRWHVRIMVKKCSESSPGCRWGGYEMSRYVISKFY